VFCRQAFYVLSLGLHFLKRKLSGQTKAGDMSALCYDVLRLLHRSKKQQTRL